MPQFAVWGLIRLFKSKARLCFAFGFVKNALFLDFGLLGIAARAASKQSAALSDFLIAF